jgi:hypothetical protein
MALQGVASTRERNWSYLCQSSQQGDQIPLKQTPLWRHTPQEVRLPPG